MTRKNWDEIAEAEFNKLDTAGRQDWGELRELTLKR